jgi:hypothetical protein
MWFGGRVVDFATGFLEDVYTAEEPENWEDPFAVTVDHRLWALKLTRKLEARRVRQESVTPRKLHVVDPADVLREARLAWSQKSLKRETTG